MTQVNARRTGTDERDPIARRCGQCYPLPAMQSVLNAIAALLGLTALFGYLNHRFLHLPQTIGLALIALVASIAALVLDHFLPTLDIRAGLTGAVERLDFSHALIDGMLGLLLFAGGLHVDLGDLRAQRAAIASMATVGLLLSTFVTGLAVWALFGVLGVELPLVYALLFGALISPTDPVAVLGILKSVRVPRTLEAKIAGESLFNDGVGVVVFTIIAGIAAGEMHGGGAAPGAGAVLSLFAAEAGGGIALGLLTGLVAFLAMRSIDEYVLEVIITLALVMVTYQLAAYAHVSGPVAVVVAGLLIGNHGTRLAMSSTTREHLIGFWRLVDEILNAVLFLLIGVEVLVIPLQPPLLLAAALAIPVVLGARLVSVAVPLGLLSPLREFTRGAVRVLTWGGLRGGISVALALSLPASPERNVVLTTCYVVVVFSIVVQGLTIGPLVRRIVPAAPGTNSGAES